MTISSIQEVIADFSSGKPVILVDDASRENEGDIVVSAAHITPEIVNFMAVYGRGLICIPMTAQYCDELDFYPMVPSSPMGSTAFTVSIDSKNGITTGISAHDRADTISKVVNPSCGPNDFVRPGHLFPLRAQKGGVLSRSGHTEASVDLCLLSNLPPVAVICEILNLDGSMSRLPQLETFSATHQIRIGLIDDLIHHRTEKEDLFEKSEECLLSDYAFTFYTDKIDGTLWVIAYDKKVSLGLLSFDTAGFEDLCIDFTLSPSDISALIFDKIAPKRGKNFFHVVRCYNSSVTDISSLPISSLVKMASPHTVFLRLLRLISFFVEQENLHLSDSTQSAWRSLISSFY